MSNPPTWDIHRWDDPVFPDRIPIMSASNALPQAPRRSLVETAIDLIRTQVETGAWKVGERIPKEAELADMLQVGRNTVREAVRVLSHAKLLEVRQGDGTYVRSSIDSAEVMRRVARTSLLDHFEMRAVLETAAARLAAERRTKQDLKRLTKLLDARGDLAKEPDTEAFVENDAEFHLAVAQASHNEALADLYRYFAASVRTNTSAALAQVDVPEPDLAAHRRILTAIRDQKPEQAAEAAHAVVAPIIDALKPIIGS